MQACLPSPSAALHRVLLLGWHPLVDVVCKDLTGRFLGGHDKELYIQCCGPEYDDLPLTDIKEVRSNKQAQHEM